MATVPATEERAQDAARQAPWLTHRVLNQPPPLHGLDLFSSNAPLVEACVRDGAGSVIERAAELGRLVGGEPMEWGRLANENKPVLKTHDRYGHRIDEVEFHPAWHSLMKLGIEHELHALPWRMSATKRRGRGSPDGSHQSQEGQPDDGSSTLQGAHAARAALYMTAMQAEAGFACPITMTFAVLPALRAQPELLAEWGPLVTDDRYDPRLIPAAAKGCAIAGMAMTEKQGGSDVKANTTIAEAAGGGGAGGEYLLTGHKWFCSAPMSDLFLVLAQAQPIGAHGGGLSCFLLPRVLPDSTRNAFHIQRLKDKLGNHSNASSEIELHRAWARMVGEPGRGVPTIIEMVGHTRLDCVIGAAAGMRTGVVNATHHAAHRSTFGRLLAEQPLMKNVLADLCVEAEAACALAMRLARAYDEAEADGEQTGRAQLFKRLATAVGKYWVCKRAPNHAFESLECFGGNGYVEESGMPRLYREAPLTSIWEGSGNVMCLDVLRAVAREPGSLPAFMEEVKLAQGADRRLDEHVAGLERQLADFEQAEARARRIVEAMALALQGSLLVRHAPASVADAFCASRLTGGGLEYGTLPAGVDFDAIVARHTPHV